MCLISKQKRSIKRDPSDIAHLCSYACFTRALTRLSNRSPTPGRSWATASLIMRRWRLGRYERSIARMRLDTGLIAIVRPFCHARQRVNLDPTIGVPPLDVRTRSLIGGNCRHHRLLPCHTDALAPPAARTSLKPRDSQFPVMAAPQTNCRLANFQTAAPAPEFFRPR
jgi:hypothetical protein